MVGAHLDSVIAGPGINDNGSGTSTILEIAEQLAALKYTNKLQRQVRFAFWVQKSSGYLALSITWTASAKRSRTRSTRT